MRWITVVLGLTLLTVGCKQQCFLTECDLEHYTKHLGMPADLECKATSICQPAQIYLPGKPSTIFDPDREQRFISLAESIAIALEQGNANGQGAGGQLNDNLGSFRGRFDTSADSMRVLALDPAIAGTDIEGALAKFDARWITQMTWNRTEQPFFSALQQFQAGGQTLGAITTQAAQFRSSLLKPLPTGGVAGITFTTDYQLTNLPNRINPNYQPVLQFQFEQPLLQGFGVEINQLRPQHLGSLLTQLQPTGGRQDGILITRIRYDQARTDFERQVQILVKNVEEGYWRLYGAYWDLYSREQALRQAFEAWKINRERFDKGRLGVADFAQSRGQFELFRGDRIEALGRVLESERFLRGILGLPMEDGTRLVPSDAPTLAPYQPNWELALNEALALRPELVLAREELKIRQLELINQKNLLLPDLRFLSTYDFVGIGSRLDGSDANNAFRSLSSNHFNNYQMGLRMDVPLGFRDAHAGVRLARLNLARGYFVLRDQEYRTTRFLTQQYRLLFQTHEVIRARRAQREAFAEQLRAKTEEYRAGRGTLDILLEAQRFWADALAREFQAIVDYNISLINFEFAKGTVLHHDNITIAEGPLPYCAQVRAVEHERQRTLALVVKEREKPVPHAPCGDGPGLGPVLPELPAHSAPSLPALLEGAPKAPPVTTTPEQLPPPQSSPLPSPSTEAPAPSGVSATLLAPKPTLPSQGPTLPMPAPMPLNQPAPAGNPWKAVQQADR